MLNPEKKSKTPRVVNLKNLKNRFFRFIRYRTLGFSEKKTQGATHG